MDGDQEPVWISKNIALAIHDRQLAEHGGLSGVRDHAGFESALARPINKWSYGERDLAVLAAAYSYGLARNHPFADGNKRTAWVLANLFLQRNGLSLRFTREEAIDAMLRLAGGETDEEQLATWFRERQVAS